MKRTAFPNHPCECKNKGEKNQLSCPVLEHGYSAPPAGRERKWVTGGVGGSSAFIKRHKRGGIVGGNAQCTYIYMKKILSQFPLNPLIMIKFSSQDIYIANNCNNVIFSIVMAYARTSMD